MEKTVAEMVRLLNRFAEDYRRYRIDGTKVVRAVFTSIGESEVGDDPTMALVDDQKLTLEEAREELIVLSQNALADMGSCIGLLAEYPTIRAAMVADWGNGIVYQK